jgi:hypothetical protein
MVCDALESIDRDTEQLTEAAQPLMDTLDVPDLYAVDGALRKIQGKPPTAVMRALTRPALVDALAYALEDLEYYELAEMVCRWGPRSESGSQIAPALLPEAGEARWQLVGQLRQRVTELLDGWREQHVGLALNSVLVDGRTLAAAARAWQVPMITGQVPDVPTAGAVLHPNRLGRTAATVIFTNLRKAVDGGAPDSVLFESLALLVAVGEAITRGDIGGSTRVEGASGVALMTWDSVSAQQALRGQLRPEIRVGEPVTAESADLSAWWPVFQSWGATSRLAQAIPTAWKLTDVEGDVLVWAMCSVAVRIAIAASASRPNRLRRLSADEVKLEWSGHYKAELPAWCEGARSVWTLMQKPRRFALRTGFPGAHTLAPKLDLDSSWPWCPTS